MVAKYEGGVEESDDDNETTASTPPTSNTTAAHFSRLQHQPGKRTIYESVDHQQPENEYGIWMDSQLTYDQHMSEPGNATDKTSPNCYYYRSDQESTRIYQLQPHNTKRPRLLFQPSSSLSSNDICSNGVALYRETADEEGEEQDELAAAALPGGYIGQQDLSPENQVTYSTNQIMDTAVFQSPAVHRTTSAEGSIPETCSSSSDTTTSTPDHLNLSLLRSSASSSGPLWLIRRNSMSASFSSVITEVSDMESISNGWSSESFDPSCSGHDIVNGHHQQHPPGASLEPPKAASGRSGGGAVDTLTRDMESWSLTHIRALRRNNLYDAFDNGHYRHAVQSARRDVMRALRRNSSTSVNSTSQPFLSPNGHQMSVTSLAKHDVPMVTTLPSSM